jgi:radical SAM protein with 4Fe4S-binding SPASM domain
LRQDAVRINKWLVLHAKAVKDPDRWAQVCGSGQRRTSLFFMASYKQPLSNPSPKQCKELERVSVQRLKKLQIELTSRCNERCVHCYIPRESGNYDMDSELLRSILDQCHNMNLDQVTFSGGEPMLHPDYLEALDRANWCNLKIRVFSNLTLLNSNIINQLKVWNVNEVQTSLYSVEPEIHDAVTRVRGSCELTKQGIERLKESGIPVFISCPVTKINKESFPAVLAFARRLGVRCAPDNMITAQSDRNAENLKYRLDNDEALRVIRDILENDSAYNAKQFLPGYCNPDVALPCVQNICIDSICINANGEVTPSPGWRKVLGDLKKQTLQDIWEHSPDIKRLRNVSLKDFPKCQNCPDIHFCGMSLEGNANENLDGDPFVIPDHICKLAEDTRKLVHLHWKRKGGAMLYRQRFDTFIRRYEDIGYIASKSDFGDRVVDSSGAVFLDVLSRKGQSLDCLAGKIAPSFIGVDIETLKEDAAGFYAMLEEDGFIVSGETEEELGRKDKRFSYSALEPKTVKKDFTPVIRRANKSSQEFLEEHFKGRPHLTSFQIELTSRCNERCLHCYIPHENKINDIEPSLFYDVLDQCRDMGLLNITLSGGEPMLHPRFCDFLRKAKDYDFSINVLSNLTLLNDDIISEMKANRLSSVQVSLYSMKAEIHDAITLVSGSFEKTKAAILRLIENDIPLQISCPTMKQNKNCYADVMNWAHDHKVRAVGDYIMMARYDRSTGNLDNRLSLEEANAVINDIISNDREYQEEMLNADIGEAEARDISNDIVCGVCIDSLCMIADGNVYPCAGWQDYVCGNLREQSLRDIWENSPKVKYLRGLRKKDFPKCLNCPDKSFCAMCMVRNANEDPDGDPLKINSHFCKVAALNRKIVIDWKSKLKVAQ